ncbi:MAG: phage scaffolding protein [Candidatus Limiplasma sp.]|nr:phage scaffolding protein [Candidatus Limiplasma sp.]
MKREELEKLGLTKEQIDAVIGINGADMEAHKATLRTREETISALTTERDGLKTQVADRDKDIASLKKSAGDNEALTKSLAELQTKYDGDTKTLQAKLEEQRYGYAAEQMFAGAPFASKLARKAAIEDFKAKGYKLAEDGRTFAEADGYLEQLKKDDPAAFLTEEPKEPKPKEPEPALPSFTKPLNGGPGGEAAPSFFTGGGLNFVRTPPATK